MGNEDSESQLISILKQHNMYIVHSIGEEADTFTGDWNYIWIPDLDILQSIPII